MAIEVKNLSFSYGGEPVLRNVSFSAQKGERIAVLGPNGAGKSTLFRCLLGFLRPQAGQILLDGQPLFRYSRRELAARIAYIPQSHSPAFNYTVLDSVLMGATGRLGSFSSPGRAETERALRILESLGIAHLAGRGCRKISGGERQLMLLARALVQDAELLVMDEPTASLDYGNSYRVMERIEALGEAGYTVIFSTHEPNQAFRYAGRVLALRDGGIAADGAPGGVLTPEVLSRLYGIRVAVREVEADGERYYVCVPCRGGEGTECSSGTPK